MMLVKRDDLAALSRCKIHACTAPLFIFGMPLNADSVWIQEKSNPAVAHGGRLILHIKSPNYHQTTVFSDSYVLHSFHLSVLPIA